MTTPIEPAYNYDTLLRVAHAAATRGPSVRAGEIVDSVLRAQRIETRLSYHGPFAGIDPAILEAAVQRAQRVFGGPPRDPKRIPEMLELLRIVWEEHSDLRLGQLITVLTRHGETLFYVDDTAMSFRLGEAAATGELSSV